MILIALGAGLLYFLLQVYYVLHWRSIRSAVRPHPGDDWPGVTLLVVARNEQAHIRQCIHSLLAQQYPADKLEILVIDDHSTDDTASLASSISDPRIRVLSLKDHPQYIQSPATKKSAITLAAAAARHELILMTDADSVAGPDWAAAHVAVHLDSQSVFQSGPVLTGVGDSPLLNMQAIEYHALMVVTGAGLRSGLHDLANGANMLFTKQAFHQVGGYAGNLEYASGDDLFLAEKMRAMFPSGLAYVKSPGAIVRTEAAHGWPDLFRQRLRWAGKNKALRNQAVQRIWLFVGAIHLFLAVLLSGGLLGMISLIPFLILLLLKWGADALLLQAGISFSGDRRLWRHFALSQVLYSGYVLAMGVRLISKVERVETVETV